MVSDNSFFQLLLEKKHKPRNKSKESTSHQTMSGVAVAARPCGFHLGLELVGIIQTSLVILRYLL